MKNKIYVLGVKAEGDRPALYIELADTTKLSDWMDKNPTALINSDGLFNAMKAVAKDVFDRRIKEINVKKS